MDESVVQDGSPEAVRPYRSHLRPACIPCKKRKSRCQNDDNARACFMCRNHGTECVFPDTTRTGAGKTQSSANPISSRRRRPRETGSTSSRTSLPSARDSPSSAARSGIPARDEHHEETQTISSSRRHRETGITPTRPLQRPASSVPTPPLPGLLAHQAVRDSLNVNPNPAANRPVQSPSLDTIHLPDRRPSPGGGRRSLTLRSHEDDHLNLHIVGPAGTNDSQIVSDYLSRIPGSSSRNTKIVRPAPVTRQTRPVLFTMVQKRPLGVTLTNSPSAEKLDMLEKLVEPHAENLINEFFQRVQPCMPLLDEASFRRQYAEDKSCISSALLASVYAHAIIYWQSSRILSEHRCPDIRYIWNLSNEAIYSELRLSPSISTIEAIILDIGGRPTTSLIGNGALLGSAVAMAHSFGLNHSPLLWEIPYSEKLLRMKIWWNLLIHDRWISLANGTPPHLIESQFDVPPPSIVYLTSGNAVNELNGASAIYIALYGLTEVLNSHLEHIYNVSSTIITLSSLEFALNQWVESLKGNTRHIILRGARLDTQGAANLRLAYLTTRLLQQRIQVESDKQKYAMEDDRLQNRYTQAKRTCEEILILTSELQPAHLGDFWISTTAFAFPATVNFLLRCALETNHSPDQVVSSGSFHIAKELVSALRLHQDKYGWELGDVCLAQHSEIIEKIQAGTTFRRNGDVGSGGSSGNSGGTAVQDFSMPDSSLIDHLFPSLWDPLQTTW